MFKKLKTFEIKHRYLILPVIVYFLCNKVQFVNNRLNILTDDKIGIIISMSSVFLGMLLATFTLYASFPRTSKAMQRVISSGHDKIFKKSIFTGSILFSLCILAWVLDINLIRIADLFLMGATDVLISIWYIYVITDYL